MKKIFFITNNYPAFGESFVENEMIFLSNSFEKIYIISLNSKGKLVDFIPKNCEIFRINPKDYRNVFKSLIYLWDKNYIYDFFKNLSFSKIKKLFFFQYISKIIEKKILQIIKKEKLNKNEIIIYSYWFREGAYAGINLKRKNIVKKVISRAHGYDLFLERGYQPLKKETLNIIDKVYPCSKIGEIYLKSKYQNVDKLECSYLGTINKNIFVPKEKNKIINIVSCSNIILLKRVNLIIEGLAYLSKNLIEKYELNWIHIGDGIEQENTVKLAENKLKNINFKFIGRLSNEDILKFYEKNDIYLFLHMSSSEGLPVSMMEVQSFGIPIIATNVGGVSEIVNEKTGILLSDNPKIEEITEAIEKMINLSNKNYKEYQKNSYNNWKENFNAEKNYLKFIKKIKNREIRC